MKRVQLLLAAAGVLILSIVLVQPVKATIASMQEQIAVTIVVNVTAPSPSPSSSPVAYEPESAPLSAAGAGITSTISLRPASPALEREFHAEGLNFIGPSKTIAQAQVQHPVLVQAEVTPNPKATLLYSNSDSVTINATSGTTQQIPCAFTVTVDMFTAWELEQGLSNDFSSDFSGKDLANNTFQNSATPQPTSTPYVVYADDKSEWSVLDTGNSLKTFCVTLTITVPASVTAGTYSTNAVYTLFN